MRKNSSSLTQKQKRVYEFIREYIESNSVSPTVTELAEALCVASLRTVTQYLESLEKKGLILRSRHQKRGIKLLDYNPLSETVTLPVVSAAGCDNMSVFAEQSFDEFITLDRDFLHGRQPEDVVVFRAVGESMVDAGINSNDLVLAQMTQEVKENDKVVAVVDGMAVIKQIHFSPNAVILAPMSHDQQYRPIIMKRNFQVFGKVIDVIKNSFGREELTYEAV